MAKKNKDKGKGKEQRKKTPLGRARIDYREVYSREVEADFDPNEQEFRFKAIRPDIGNRWIDRLVTDCSWHEDGGSSFNNPVTMSGAMTLRKPRAEDQHFRLNDGHEIECFVRWPSYHGKSEGGISERGWLKLWRMRIQTRALTVAEGGWTFELADDTRQLYRSSDDFSFKKTKKGRHKRGWRLDQIVEHVANRYHFKVAHCPKGQVWTTKKTFKDHSPMEVIQWAVEHEAHETGAQFTIHWDAGRLRINQVRRNPKLYTFGKLIMDANLTRAYRKPVATEFLVHFTEKVKKEGASKATSKKREVTVTNQKLRRRFGFIHKEIKAKHKIDSAHEARKWALGEMRRRTIPVPEVSFTHPGVAMLHRGDAIKFKLPEYGFEGIKKGATALAFVQSVEHQLSGGDYTMDITLSFRDMLDPQHLKKLKDKALRAKKKREKDKKKEEANA